VSAIVKKFCFNCGDGAKKETFYKSKIKLDQNFDFAFSARRQPDQRHFEVVRCMQCDLLFSDLGFSESLTQYGYHESEYYYKDLEPSITDSYLPYIKKATERVRFKNLFVEIGGGRGFLLKEGVSLGFKKAIEIEPSENAFKIFSAASHAEKFFHESFTRESLRGEKADLICFFQVLDHMSNPKKFLEDVYFNLNAQGVILCVVHDASAILNKILGRRSPIYDVAHTCFFTRETIKKFFTSVGYKKIEVFPVSNSYPLFYWLHLSPLPCGVKKIVQMILKMLKLDHFKLSLRAGNLGVIASKND